jgi:hypothetical protein
MASDIVVTALSLSWPETFSNILDIIIYLEAAWFGWIDLGKRGNTPYIPGLAALITCGATVPKAHLAEADRGVGE